MREKLSEFHDLAVDAGFRVERTAHGLPFIPEAEFTAKDSNRLPRAFSLLRKIIGVLVLLAGLGMFLYFSKARPEINLARLDFRTLNYGLIAAGCILFFSLILSQKTSLFARASGPAKAFFRRLFSHGVLKRTSLVVRTQHEPMLSSLPETPADVALEGLDTGASRVDLLQSEAEGDTSILHFTLPSAKGVRFNARYKPVSMLNQTLRLSTPVGGYADARTKTYYAYCIYAMLPARIRSKGTLYLFNGKEVIPRIEKPSDAIGAAVRSLLHGDVDAGASKLSDAAKLIASDKLLTKAPAWAFQSLFTRLQTALTLDFLINRARELSCVRFTGSEAIVRITMNVELEKGDVIGFWPRGQVFKAAAKQELADAAKRMLRVIRKLKQAGAV